LSLAGQRQLQHRTRPGLTTFLCAVANYPVEVRILLLQRIFLVFGLLFLVGRFQRQTNNQKLQIVLLLWGDETFGRHALLSRG